MADEIVPSGIGDLIAGEVLATEFLMLLADRDGSVINHPALFYAQASSPSSNVVRVPHLGLGGTNLLTSTTPGSEMANVALSDGSTDVTIAAKGKVYMADEFASYLAAGKLDESRFAFDAAISVAQTLISLIANVGDDFTGVEGNAGGDLTWADMIDASTTLDINKASGQMCAILHPRQWGDLKTDTLSLGFAPAMVLSGAINTGLGASFKGSFGGVDYFTSSHVPTSDAGVNRAGCLFTRGGIAWADAPLPAKQNSISLGRARFQVFNQARHLADSYIVAYIVGVAKAIDAAGVTVKSSAT